MRLEQLGAPQQETPQLRYAALNRAVENGLASDEVWKDLVHVCLELELHSEAIRAWRNLQDSPAKFALESLLLCRPEATDQVAQSDAAAAATDARTPTADLCRSLPTGGRAPNGGRHADVVPEVPDRPTVCEHVAEAIHFLMQDQIPIAALVATISFPLLLGLGGFVENSHPTPLLPVLAAVPVLGLLGMVGALGRRILVDAASGDFTPPHLPGCCDLIRDSLRFLVDIVLVAVACFALPVGLALGGVAAPGWGLLLCATVLLAPMVHLLRQLRGDTGSLNPALALRAIRIDPSRYLGIAAACLALAAPAVATAWLARSAPLWLQAAFVGPFVVVPLFAASRMLGTFADSIHVELRKLLFPVERIEAVRATMQPRAQAARVESRPARRLVDAEPSLLDHLVQQPAVDALGLPVRGNTRRRTHAPSSAR